MASAFNISAIGKTFGYSKRRLFHQSLRCTSSWKEGVAMAGFSIHSGNIKEVHQVPMRVIMRPLIPTLDEEKVLSLMETLRDPEQEHKVPPIDILWVKGSEQGDYYFSFGGCHRYEAYKRLQRDTIPCKIVKSTVEDIKVYLGSSMPDLK